MSNYERWLAAITNCKCLHPNAEVCFERANPPPCDDMEMGDYVERWGDCTCGCGCHCIFMEEEE